MAERDRSRFVQAGKIDDETKISSSVFSNTNPISNARKAHAVRYISRGFVKTTDDSSRSGNCQGSDALPLPSARKAHAVRYKKALD